MNSHTSTFLCLDMACWQLYPFYLSFWCTFTGNCVSDRRSKNLNTHVVSDVLFKNIPSRGKITRSSSTIAFTVVSNSHSLEFLKIKTIGDHSWKISFFILFSWQFSVIVVSSQHFRFFSWEYFCHALLCRADKFPWRWPFSQKQYWPIHDTGNRWKNGQRIPEESS